MFLFIPNILRRRLRGRGYRPAHHIFRIFRVALNNDTLMCKVFIAEKIWITHFLKASSLVKYNYHNIISNRSFNFHRWVHIPKLTDLMQFLEILPCHNHFAKLWSERKPGLILKSIRRRLSLTDDLIQYLLCSILSLQSPSTQPSCRSWNFHRCKR